MSSLTVTPEHVTNATRPMVGISAQIDALHAGLGRHVDAGAGTNGASSVQASWAAWSTALPQFSEAASRLLAAMTEAASGYQSTDEGVADTMGGGEQPV